MESILKLYRFITLIALIVIIPNLTGCTPLPNDPAFFISSQDLREQSASIDKCLAGECK